MIDQSIVKTVQDRPVRIALMSEDTGTRTHEAVEQAADEVREAAVEARTRRRRCATSATSSRGSSPSAG